MNDAKPSGLKFRHWLVLAAAASIGMPLAVLGCVLLWVASALRLNGDAQALRNSFLGAANAGFERKIEVNAGWPTVSIAKTGLEFAKLPPEARQMLRAFHGGEVGVYHLDRRAGRRETAAGFSVADEAMKRRGWERLVGVMDRDQVVAIYVEREGSPENNFKVCFAVKERDQLVVGSARADLEPIMELAREKMSFPGKDQHRINAPEGKLFSFRTRH
jgi:hypothetical protein